MMQRTISWTVIMASCALAWLFNMPESGEDYLIFIFSLVVQNNANTSPAQAGFFFNVSMNGFD